MNKFVMPSINLFGLSAIEQITDYLNEKKHKTCLIITDRFLSETPAYERLLKVLMEKRIGFKSYKETIANPTVDCVAKAYNLVRKDSCDLIISLGGGSAHDLAKAVGIIASYGGCIKTYEGVNKVPGEIIPLIAINTTSGTGSEVTRFTIITDTSRHVKMAIIDDHIVPWIAVNDTNALMTMPKGLTAATGMDALTHAIEAYVSTDADTLTNAYALEAITLIHTHLLDAYNNGDNTEAREKMAKAQFMAGLAFSNASLGFVHAIAHQLGGIYNLPHGLCNAVLLPFVLKAIGEDLSGTQFKSMCQAVGKDVFASQNKLAYPHFTKVVVKMNQQLGIPCHLKELGVNKSDFKKISEFALKDPCSLTSPVQFSQDQIIQILNWAY